MTDQPTVVRPPDQKHDGFRIEHLEDAMKSIWHDDVLKPRGDHDILRACSATFILPLGADGYSRWQKHIAEIAARIPSRIIVLEVNTDNASAPLDADTFAICHRRSDHSLICSEVAQIRAGIETASRLSSICRALSISDLPVFLLAFEDSGLNAEILVTLAHDSDAVVSDSARPLTIPCVASDDTAAYDLAWPRLTPWRSALGHTLSTCRRLKPARFAVVEIQGTKAATSLFAGWLSLLLKWEIRPNADGLEATVPGASGSVRVNLVSDSGKYSGLTHLRISSPEGATRELTIDIEADQRFHVKMSGDHPDVIAHIPYRPVSFAEELAAVFHSHGIDTIYHESRRLADRIVS